ncbi:DDE_3 domain-containing protein [Trichonephila clavipes]|nr:DDE_3 domain-containing protein [Trichonephila clavipes]
MLDGRTPLHVFERGSVIVVRNRDQVLEPHIHFSRGACGPKFILMDDDARRYRVLLVNEFLESEDIPPMKRTFWLNGYVNKQNCRIWSEANPQVYVETPLHPEKLTVWCALWAGGILLQKR